MLLHMKVIIINMANIHAYKHISPVPSSTLHVNILVADPHPTSRAVNTAARGLKERGKYGKYVGHPWHASCMEFYDGQAVNNS
jgi:hypothetical protein